MNGGDWFSERYDEIFPFRPPTLAFLERHLLPAGRVLDIGCGPGRYAAALVTAEREAQGLDIDPDMIVRARLDHPEATFHELDLAAVGELRCTFTGAFSLGNSMAFLAPEGWSDFLAALSRQLAPGSPWLFQTVNFDPLLGRDHHAFPALVLADGVEVHREYVYVARDATSVSFRIHRVQGGERVLVSENVLYPQAAAAYRRWHEEAGWVPVTHAGDFAGNPFAADASGANIQVWRSPGA